MKKHLLLLLMLCLTGVGSVRGADVEVTVKNLSDFTSYIATANLNTYNHYILRVTNNISIGASSNPAITINSGANVTINIAADKTISFTPASGAFIQNYGNLTLEGQGTITSNSTGILLFNKGTLHVKSGTYKSKKSVITNWETLRIDNGTFQSTFNGTTTDNLIATINNPEGGTANIYGGTFIGNTSYNSSNGYTFGAIGVTNGTVNVYGGIFDNIGGNYARSATASGSRAYLNIYGGYFKKQIYSFSAHLSYGDYTRYDLYGNTSGFSNSTPTVVGKDVKFDNRLITEGTFTFNPEDYNLVADGIDVTENAGNPKTWTVSSGTQQTYTVRFVNNTGHGDTPSDMSEQTTIPANLPDYAEDDHLVKWYLDEAHTTPAVAGTSIKELVGESATEIILYANWESNCVEVNNASDFKTAIESVTPSSVNVILTGNISNLTACTIPSGKTVHIDFNGYRISTSTGYAITVNGNLYLTDTSSNANGGITSSEYDLVATNPGSYLEVNAGVYSASNYLAEIGGNATINGGTFTSSGSYCIRANNASSDVTINGGLFTSTKRTIMCSADGAKINIYGGRIDGGRIDSSAGTTTMYGGMKKKESDGSSFTTILKNDDGTAYLVTFDDVNGTLMNTFPYAKDVVVDDNNLLTAGTFSFDPTLPVYNCNGKSIVAEGYRAVAQSTTPATWTIKKAFILGDVNKDGAVNIGDIIALANLIQDPTSGDYDLDAADVNQDNEINIGDITALSNLIQANN